jgi:hypothetical protein
MTERFKEMEEAAMPRNVTTNSGAEDPTDTTAGANVLEA